MKLKCKSSELLTLYVLLRHFSESYLTECAELALERVAFQSACDVVDLFLEAKRSAGRHLAAIHADLNVALENRMRTHKEAFGNHGIIPKMHLSSMFEPQEYQNRSNCK